MSKHLNICEGPPPPTIYDYFGPSTYEFCLFRIIILDRLYAYTQWCQHLFSINHSYSMAVLMGIYALGCKKKNQVAKIKSSLFESSVFKCIRIYPCLRLLKVNAAKTFVLSLDVPSYFLHKSYFCDASFLNLKLQI